MMEVDLFTQGGEYVVTALIAPFQIMPEVLNWGSRVFVKREDGQYYEGCAVWVLEHRIKPL